METVDGYSIGAEILEALGIVKKLRLKWNPAICQYVEYRKWWVLRCGVDIPLFWGEFNISRNPDRN